MLLKQRQQPLYKGLDVLISCAPAPRRCVHYFVGVSVVCTCWSLAAMQPPYNYGPPPPQGAYNYSQTPAGPPSQGGQQRAAPSSYPGYQQFQPFQQQPSQQQGQQQMPHVSSFSGPVMSGPYSGQPSPFLPSQPQQYSAQQPQYGAQPQYSGQQQYVPTSYTPGPPSTGAPPPPAPQVRSLHACLCCQQVLSLALSTPIGAFSYCICLRLQQLPKAFCSPLLLWVCRCHQHRWVLGS